MVSPTNPDKQITVQTIIFRLPERTLSVDCATKNEHKLTYLCHAHLFATKEKVAFANLHTDLPVSVNSKLVKKLVCLELKLRSRTIEFVKSRLHRVIIAPFHSTVEKKMKTILILKFVRVSKKYCCSRFTCKTLLQRVG